MIKATNLKRKKARKKQEVVNRQKFEAIVEKHRRDRGGNRLSIEDNRYFESNIYSTDPDQEDNFNYPIKD